jgi:BlaI family penicillinase repressor
MKQKDLQLSDSEWQLMKVLWECAPASVNEITEKAKPLANWHPKTVRTMLIRLDKKGIVDYAIKDNVQHYRPLYSREDCEFNATESFLQRVFDGALTPMVAHFTNTRKLSSEEKAALLKILHGYDNNKEA